MFKNISLLIGACTITSLAQASALVKMNQSKGELEVITQLNYYGSAATAALAKISSEEISRMWNESKTRVTLDGKSYSVKFRIGYSLNHDQKLRNPSQSCGENFIEILNKTQSDDRSYYGLYGRSGGFFTSDDLGRSTTAAHEYGHGLGLEHNDPEQLSATIPGIMFARGTLVKSQFQWNPTAQPGQPGGSLNPVYRKVRAVDVSELNFSMIQFNGSLGCLGQGVATAVTLTNEIPVSVASKTIKSIESLPFGVEIESPSFENELESEAHDH